MIVIAIVSILSLLSLVIQIINITPDYNSNDLISIVAIGFLGLLFIVPMLKRFKKIKPIVDWVFIVVSVGSLVSQGIAYGKHRNTNAVDLLAVSVVSTLLASFLGHYIRETPYEKMIREFQIDTLKKGGMQYTDKVIEFQEELQKVLPKLISKKQIPIYGAKMIFIIVPLITYIMDHLLNDRTVVMEGVVIGTLAGLSVYLLVTILVMMYAFETSVKISISTIDINMSILLNKKLYNLISSAIALTGLSILVGIEQTPAAIISGSSLVVALVLEHIKLK